MTDRESHINQMKEYTPEYYWLALKLIPRLSIQKKLVLVKRYGIEQLFNQPPSQQQLAISEKQYQGIVNPDWFAIEKIIAHSQQAGAVIVSYQDANYPQLLKQIYDPPLVLFVKGDTRLLNRQQIAIVGSRNASIHGREAATLLAKELTECGLVVTSGLALGIDAFAHKGAVDNQQATIAVIATGIDIVYPARNKGLAKQIIEYGGAIISEFLPHTPPKAGHFPKRNRIISGLSQGVLVIEAAMKSGSLITARCALEQNRDVYAMPGNIQNPQVKGCHWLIKQGAKLVDEVADIIEEVNVNSDYGLHLKGNNNRNKEKGQGSKKSCDQDLFNDSLLASVGYEITPVDTVVSRSKLPTDVVLTRLTMLELRGLVSAVPGGYLKIK
ncbi:DNA protecting protein DprA [Thalassotalea insulae]|uniref:DNA protecting protein DprA n=1 Tax=Thalassotalea insulae TaxID=2056778 RepID=A0ABQ6GV34_9GAMM|nr:DNA-processing protein DprA [Thalassotalea insulae]GLX78515.1 DNA protecting protein DprA [Thalassotalea insulae]